MIKKNFYCETRMEKPHDLMEEYKCNASGIYFAWK